ncbi:MAG: PfkB family carbohydrate kinase, partial [Lachnospiraceae bacterium]
MGIVVMGAVFVDIKGFPEDIYIPDGRNVGHVEYIHGGVSRNVVEDIANIELRPTFVGIVDDSALGEAVVKKLKNHKVNTDYILTVPGGMGTWLAVFDHNGDLAGSISQRPNLMPILDLLEEKGDEIFENADSVVVEVDMDRDIIKKVVALSKKHNKKLYGAVSNMSIAVERRDFLQSFDCFICNQQEAGMLFMEDYTDKTPEQLCDILAKRVMLGRIPAMIVTMGDNGAVYADMTGDKGVCQPQKVRVKDT